MGDVGVRLSKETQFLLCCGHAVLADSCDVERRARGSYIVRYSYRAAKLNFTGAKQLHSSDECLEVLYLPWWHQFRLVAWSD